jgi:hypothetical protein
MATLTVVATMVQGAASWCALTLTRDTLDCWHLDATATSDLACRCLWSLDVALALTRLSNVNVCVALRCALVGDGIVVLCAGKYGGWAAEEWRAALAFFLLPSDLAGAILQPFGRFLKVVWIVSG